jgi:hypothetical protein
MAQQPTQPLMNRVVSPEFIKLLVRKYPTYKAGIENWQQQCSQLKVPDFKPKKKLQQGFSSTNVSHMANTARTLKATLQSGMSLAFCFK